MPKRNEYKFPWWSLRNWHGMTTGGWFRLLSHNRFAVSPSKIPLALSITGASLVNSLASVVENVMYGKALQGIELDQPPLFVIGHWRTGTTLLHELLVRDPRFNFPTTYQCMSPRHFLHTRHTLKRLVYFLMPRQRPMDNVRMGWDRPQEDEFALCNLGVPSPYLYWAFPNRECLYDRFLDLEGLSEQQVEAWKAAFRFFLLRLQLRREGRIVLKSPTHTARVTTILEMFPDAQFIHLTRNPYVIYPSTIKTWCRLSEALGLQTKIRDDLEEYVIRNYQRMYGRFEKQRQLVPAGNIVDLRYEDLVDDTMGSMERIYAELSLGDFETAKPGIEQYLNETKNYRTNTFEISDETRRIVTDAYGDYIAKYKYTEPG